MPPLPLILASASQRRRKILAGLGVAFEAVAPAVDEILRPDDPRGTGRENAERKCRWCEERYPGRCIIAADTVIDFAGRCVAKPADRADAERMLRLFSGCEQTIVTAVALYAPASGRAVHVVESAVVFRDLTDADIRSYCAAVDPLDKAGAYDIDQHGERIIASRRGSYSNIMGLPVELVGPWLTEQGLRP